MFTAANSLRWKVKVIQSLIQSLNMMKWFKELGRSVAAGNTANGTTEQLQELPSPGPRMMMWIINTTPRSLEDVLDTQKPPEELSQNSSAFPKKKTQNVLWNICEFFNHRRCLRPWRSRRFSSEVPSPAPEPAGSAPDSRIFCSATLPLITSFTVLNTGTLNVLLRTSITRAVCRLVAPPGGIKQERQKQRLKPKDLSADYLKHFRRERESVVLRVKRASTKLPYPNPNLLYPPPLVHRHTSSVRF